MDASVAGLCNSHNVGTCLHRAFGAFVYAKRANGSGE
jgi:hypothetical protein